jgi:hypothetical protein
MQSAASSARSTDRRRSLSPIMEYQPKLIRDNSRSGFSAPGSMTGRNSISRKEIPASHQKQTEQEKGKDITKKDTKVVVTEEEKQKKIMQAKNQSRLRIIQKRSEEQQLMSQSMSAINAYKHMNTIFVPDVGFISSTSQQSFFSPTSQSPAFSDGFKSNRSETSESRFVQSLLSKMEEAKESRLHHHLKKPSSRYI